MKTWARKKLIQKLIDINSRFANDINAKFTGLLENFNVFTFKYEMIYWELQQYKSFNSHLLNRIIQLEHNIAVNSQYSRKMTIEVSPVPAKIHDVLETKASV